VAEIAHRAKQLGQVGHEREQSADREPAFLDGPGPEPDHGQHAGHLDQRNDARECPANAGRGELGVDHALALAEKSLSLVLGAVARLHQRGIGEALLGYGTESSAAAALLARGMARQAGEVAGREIEGRRENQGVHGKLGIEQEQSAAKQGDPRHGGYGLAQPTQYEPLDGLDVTAHARDQVSEAAPIEGVEGQPLEV
jgi:hypothetical protein